MAAGARMLFVVWALLCAAAAAPLAAVAQETSLQGAQGAPEQTQNPAQNPAASAENTAAAADQNTTGQNAAGQNTETQASPKESPQVSPRASLAQANVSPAARVMVASIIFVIDGQRYADPPVDARGPVRFGILMQRVSFRQGDFMSAKQLARRTEFSLNRMRALRYFYADASQSVAAYAAGEAKDGVVPVTVYFALTKSNGFAFAIDNLYGYFGWFMPGGTQLHFYGGVNRQEFGAVYESLPFGFAGLFNNAGNASSSQETYPRTFFAFKADAYNYWVWPTLDPLASFEAFMYGARARFELTPHPTFTYSAGAAFTGMTALSGSQASREYLGVPTGDNETGISADMRNVLEYSLAAGSTGMFASFLRIRVPYILGWAAMRAGDAMLMYDTTGATVSAQVGFTTGMVHHAFSAEGGFLTGFISGAPRPYHAKVNLGSSFYNTTSREVDLSRRGAYPDKVTVGDTGYAARLEYKIGVRTQRFLGISAFFFYDVGAAADEYQDLAENTRHTVGPGVIFSFADPLSLDFKFSLGFGGEYLKNKDGKPIWFEVSVASNN